MFYVYFGENKQNRFGSNYSLHCSPPDVEPAAAHLSCTRPQDSPTTLKKYLTLQSHHGSKNYEDTKPQMSSLLVFNRLYRLEILDPSCELAPI
jgi:hypothetical protein